MKKKSKNICDTELAPFYIEKCGTLPRLELIEQAAFICNKEDASMFKVAPQMLSLIKQIHQALTDKTIEHFKREVRFNPKKLSVLEQSILLEANKILKQIK